MRAWIVREPGPVDGGPPVEAGRRQGPPVEAGRRQGPLELVERPAPVPGPRELRVRVSVCGVCRTDLHVAEGDLPVHRPQLVPGHEVVGVVDALGEGATRFSVGERVGIAWLRWTCGECRFCLRGDENLCVAPRFTGWDDDGGYAEFAVVDERYAYGIPDVFDDEHTAPLLCAGIIGYRALRRSELPRGGRLGIYGFGGSAHLAAQVAVFEGATVHVRTRSEPARGLARELGAASVGDSADPVPGALDSAVVFAPAGSLVPVALRALDRGGTVSLAGIHMSDIPSFPYLDLFEERQVRSVTANTRRDGEEFLDLAARIPIRVTTTPFAFEAADDALRALAHDQVEGAAVLRVG